MTQPQSVAAQTDKSSGDYANRYSYCTKVRNVVQVFGSLGQHYCSFAKVRNNARNVAIFGGRDPLQEGQESA
jgi:hypothetical protein